VTELTRRVIISVIAAPLAVLAIYQGGWVLATVLGALAGVSAWEVLRMARAGGAYPMTTLGIVIAAVIPIFVHAYYLNWFTPSVAAAAVVFLAVTASVIWLRGVDGRPFVAVAVTVFGVLYASMITFVYPLRYFPYRIGEGAGTAVVMLPVFIVWGTDTGAYTFGRLFGNRKLMPSVSPGKTVAGAVGGLFVAIVVCWLYLKAVLEPVAQLAMTPVSIIVFGAAISVAAQTGDLLESLLKREAGVKDSSSLLPGHGGVLDRIDSQLFALPVAYLLLEHLVIPFFT